MIWMIPLTLIAGIAIGRMYGWMKYRYPESEEMIKLKVAKLKAERARYEAQAEAHRSSVDDMLDERITVRRVNSHPRKKHKLA